MDEVMLSHADEDPSGRRPGSFRHTPQGILHGANEAYRAEFQARRKPGMRRTSTSVGVDTYRPLSPSPEFVAMSSLLGVSGWHAQPLTVRSPGVTCQAT